MRRWLRSLFGKSQSFEAQVQTVRHHYEGFSNSTDESLKRAFRETRGVLETIAIVAVVASRTLGFSMFDVQLHGALALAHGRIAEMQTGEGKTLAAVPAVAWYAREGNGVHVMTANDYLARRDAEWMGPI